jgi:hypothetical protein
MNAIDRFFDEKFFALLGKRRLGKRRGGGDGLGGRRLRGASASAQLAALGFTVAPGLARLVDFAGEYDANPVGALRMFPMCDELPDGENALGFMLNHTWRIDSVMFHTLALGDNGSGDLWLVSMAETSGRHDVFFFDHDEGASRTWPTPSKRSRWPSTSAIAPRALGPRRRNVLSSGTSPISATSVSPGSPRSCPRRRRRRRRICTPGPWTCASR